MPVGAAQVLNGTGQVLTALLRVVVRSQRYIPPFSSKNAATANWRPSGLIHGLHAEAANGLSLSKATVVGVAAFALITSTSGSLRLFHKITSESFHPNPSRSGTPRV